MLNKSSNRYLARVYYHDHIEHEFSGDTLSHLQAKLHDIVSSLTTGANGLILDTQNYNQLIDSCRYQK